MVVKGHLSVVVIFIIFQIIFGTGDTLQAITVSANVGFVRAAKNQVKAIFEMHEKKSDRLSTQIENSTGTSHTSFYKYFREYHLLCFYTSQEF